MSAWGGFWIAVAIVVTFGTVNWSARVDCGWLNIKAACNYVNAYYLPKEHNPAR